MHKFSEELLQFIWKHKLLKPVPFISYTGNEITILNYGEINHDSGPDFFNARIKINGIVLAGNIELHIKSSDWLKHNHQRDKNYDTIILHAVYEHDLDLEQNLANGVEVLELKHLIDPKIFETYTAFSSTRDKIPCAKDLHRVDEFKFLSWMERMMVERMEVKVKRLEEWFHLNSGDYAQTFYCALMRNFGFQVNALPFELLAQHLPIVLLLKHSDNLMQLEALLLGMSGLLEDQFENKYIQQLQNEFQFLSKKYTLIPLKKELFKFSKLRPANFPTLRLAQLAALIHKRKELLSRPQDFVNKLELMKVLCVELDGYWRHHYSLNGNLNEKHLRLGEVSAENLIINTFAPFFFFYAKKLGKDEYREISFELLNQCKREENSKLKLFEAKRNSLTSAAGSQAAIQLYDSYCKTKSCLKCGIAASILNPV